MDQAILDKLKTFQIYRDDGFFIFNGQIDANDINAWLEKFQGEINRIAGNDFLKFTAVIWTPNTTEKIKVGKVTNLTTNSFPFLDMEMRWDDSGSLKFGVHMKPNQQLKYLNSSSSHNPGCIKAIPNGVSHRLAKLTSVDNHT
jgi:hypothetical protein